MTRRTRFAVGGALLVVALGALLPAAVMAGPDGSASVQFGNPDVGSPGPVGPGIVLHDQSANAQFNLVPRTAVVAAGGTVTFTVGVAGATGNNIVPHQSPFARWASGRTMLSTQTCRPFQSTTPTVRLWGQRRRPRRRLSRSSSTSLGDTW